MGDGPVLAPSVRPCSQPTFRRLKIDEPQSLDGVLLCLDWLTVTERPPLGNQDLLFIESNVKLLSKQTV
jgi:hypothetical protein